MYLIDGGLSTELERIGAQIKGQLWTGHNLVDSPELVELAHKNFVASGAEVIISSSYQLSRHGFRVLGLSDDLADSALRRSVEIARAAVGDTGCKVAASIGPYGAVLHDGSEFRGDYKVSQAQLEDFHFERLEVILSAKPDFLAVETIPNVLEAKALAQVLGKVDIPFWIAFTAASESRMWSGEPIEEAAEQIAGLPGLFAAGVNCLNPNYVAPLSMAINKVTSLPAIAYPNDGGKWDAASATWSGRDDKSLAEWIPHWIDTPIEWVGGCCGSNALDILELSKFLKESAS